MKTSRDILWFFIELLDQHGQLPLHSRTTSKIKISNFSIINWIIKLAVGLLYKKHETKSMQLIELHNFVTTLITLKQHRFDL